MICLQLLNSINLDGTEHLNVGAGSHLGDSKMRWVPSGQSCLDSKFEEGSSLSRAGGRHSSTSECLCTGRRSVFLDNSWKGVVGEVTGKDTNPRRGTQRRGVGEDVERYLESRRLQITQKPNAGPSGSTAISCDK